MNPMNDISRQSSVEPEQTISCGDVMTSAPSSSWFGKVHFGDNAKLCDDFSPNKFDIICGRDRQAFNHTGNRRFRVIIKIHRARYQACKTRDEKSKITDEIIDSIQEKCKFLKYDDTTKLWSEVSREYAHEKVSHALRSAKDPSMKKPRKKRAVRKTYTPQEDETFRQLLAAQQQIFQGYFRDETPAAEFSMDFSLIDEIASNPAISV